MEELEETLNPIPNIIVTFPVFVHSSHPNEEFVIPDINWIRPYHTDPNEQITDSAVAEQIKLAAKKAVSLVPFGVIKTSKLFKLRDFDEQYPTGYIAGPNSKIEVILIAGPVYDQRMIKDKRVTLH